MQSKVFKLEGSYPLEGPSQDSQTKERFLRRQEKGKVPEQRSNQGVMFFLMLLNFQFFFNKPKPS